MISIQDALVRGHLYGVSRSSVRITSVLKLISFDRWCQSSQNVDVNGPHHRCFELIVSSSFNQPMAVERGRSHELVRSMVGAVYVHFLRTLGDATSRLTIAVAGDELTIDSRSVVLFSEWDAIEIIVRLLSRVMIIRVASWACYRWESLFWVQSQIMNGWEEPGT